MGEDHKVMLDFSYEWILIGLLTVVGIVVGIVVLSFFTMWLKAFLAKAPVSLMTLLAMKLRGVPVGLIVDARITAMKAGITLTTDELEAHYLAEGNVPQTVQALIAAKRSNLNSRMRHTSHTPKV